MTEEIDIFKVLDYIRDTAQQAADARATRLYLDQYRKSKKALLINERKEGTIQARESYAYANPEYLILLENYKEAVKQDEYLTWMMKAAQAKVEVFRTLQANNRFIDKAHT